MFKNTLVSKGNKLIPEATFGPLILKSSGVWKSDTNFRNSYF